MKRLFGCLPVILVAVNGGCGKACDAVLNYGVVVTIVEKATGSPYQGDVTMTATDGSYIDQVINPPAPPAGPRQVALAPERPGTYRVEVQAPGHVLWVATNVRVSMDEDGCSPVTAELTAELVPQ